MALLNNECKKIMNSIDAFDMPEDTFVNIRSAVATYLIIFNARRGGEPVRLRLHQWKEALDGYWDDKPNVPEEVVNDPRMLVTFQTGKGSDHFVPLLFPPEKFKAIMHLTDKKVKSKTGVSSTNEFVFASTQNS